MKTTIRVNRKRPESMTKQITDQLTSLIESGAMPIGSYLPSERELANSLKVARNVVRGSYENLIKTGITGAIRTHTVPATIMRSDCRGDARKTPAPYRSMS